MTDDAGSVVNEYSYDSYGQPERAVETVPQPFRFTGREYDQETGLSHYRSRAYDPSSLDRTLPSGRSDLVRSR